MLETKQVMWYNIFNFACNLVDFVIKTLLFMKNQRDRNAMCATRFKYSCKSCKWNSKQMGRWVRYVVVLVRLLNFLFLVSMNQIRYRYMWITMNANSNCNIKTNEIITSFSWIFYYHCFNCSMFVTTAIL